MQRNFRIQIEDNPVIYIVTISQNEDGYLGYYRVINEELALKVFRGFETIESLFSQIRNDVNQNIGRIINVQETFLEPLPERTIRFLSN
ncbi:hypothetical protein [Flavobacterium sedimenticola]|uniref:Uncharacterized protein n=1 Tax=Flavobacterium sedimenticola TaxID=3043286 RepID=A0ABT6XQH4_9FLAO|nr:hypothetical protein [Flavobacterium sedimenticola]MDI9257268.1 hypothetical protein [Flavobacterium sedimenticola]